MPHNQPYNTIRQSLNTPIQLMYGWYDADMLLYSSWYDDEISH